MNQDSRAQLLSVTDQTIDTVIQKLSFFQQNIASIKSLQSQLLETLQVTVDILKEAENLKVYITPEKLATIRNLSQEIMFAIQPEELSNICHDTDINNSILH